LLESFDDRFILYRHTSNNLGTLYNNKEFRMTKQERLIRTLAEANKDKKMTRKVDTYEYESLEDCIKSDQVPASEIAEIFTDKAYYDWYAKRNFVDK
jgi:hypothetical protein